MNPYQLRIGQGFDVHAFAPNRPLILGGVEIPFEYGLMGHSDADVLLHALMDALLGASGLGDIGAFFPDTDPRYKGADSRVLLKEVWRRVKAQGFDFINMDAVVICQAPKILPYLPAIRQNIAKDLGTQVARIGMKGKTTEKLGFTGRGEGIAAQVGVLLVETSFSGGA